MSTEVTQNAHDRTVNLVVERLAMDRSGVHVPINTVSLKLRCGAYLAAEIMKISPLFIFARLDLLRRLYIIISYLENDENEGSHIDALSIVLSGTLSDSAMQYIEGADSNTIVYNVVSSGRDGVELTSIITTEGDVKDVPGESGFNPWSYGIDPTGRIEW